MYDQDNVGLTRSKYELFAVVSRLTHSGQIECVRAEFSPMAGALKAAARVILAVPSGARNAFMAEIDDACSYCENTDEHGSSEACDG